MTTKGMSPMRTLAQNSPSKQDSRSNENGHDQESGSAFTLIPGRAPLCPIPLPSQLTDGIGNNDLILKSKVQATTPRGKSKLLPRSDNPGGTPERQTAAGIARNRFGWHHPRFQATSGFDKDSCSSGPSLLSPRGKRGQESPHQKEGMEVWTPNKHLRSSSCSEASHISDNVGVLDAQLNSNSVQPCSVRAGNSNQSTPRSTKALRSGTNDPGYSGSTQLAGTPTRNVSRTLKYTTGSNGSSSSGATVIRAGLPGLRLGAYLSQPVRSAQPHGSDYQCADVPYFELEENPSFWNDHNVQVLIRCRPLNTSEIASQGYSRCLRQETAHTLTYIGQPEARFTFDHVACDKISQEKLFTIAGIPMVDNCMSGYNSCMFAYGQTGSGKTHTMLGDIGELEERPSDNRGITPRIFEYLFGQISVEERLRKEERLLFTCKCSFLEIYNEQITDLLEPSSTNLQMREDIKKGVYVENLREVEVRSVQDVVFLLSQGAANRRVAATNMNQESSRSHSVFTCIIESQWESESMTNLRFGRLNLVDLAGSERQKSSGAEGERLKEAANINKSLSTLGLVIMILVDVAQGKQRHVPYRDSKLTFLLQDSLGGNSKTTIIANVSPSISCASETLSTLKFAQRAKFIRNNAVVNEDASGDVLALRLQIQQLKEELNRLSRQSISRIPHYSGGKELLGPTNKDFPDGVLAVVEHSSSSSERVENDEISSQKVKALEAVVVGSLRREQAADNTAKRLREEIEHLNCLVRQREDDAQFNKMMLRFREDKVRRLEAIIDGKLCGESSQTDDKDALREELQLMRSRLDKNPELTRFAMENIRLREQLQRLQDFFDGGERDVLLGEISGLRDQLSEYVEAKLAGEGNLLQVTCRDKSIDAVNPSSASMRQEIGSNSKFESLLQEKEERIQWEAYRADDLSGQLDDARHNIHDLECELKETKEAAKELADRLQSTEASLIAAQETAAAAQATVKQIRIETEDIALQQRQSFSEIQEATSAWRLQELQLRTQLEEAQNMIMDLERVSTALDEPAEDSTQPSTTEAIMQLRLELQAMECLIEEERNYRREAEEQRLSLSLQLEHSEETCKGLTEQIEEAEARIQNLRKERDRAEEKELETSKQLLQSSEDLNDHKMVIQSLENQALLSISETSNLQGCNEKLTKVVKKKEEELKVLTGCVVFLQSELQRELELKVLEMDSRNDDHSSNLKEKLERTRRALEHAEQFNAELQSEQNAVKALEEQKDLVRADAEMETTEAISLLQSELVSLCEDHRRIRERELSAEQRVAQLEMHINTLTSEMEALSVENKQLKCLYQSTVEEKDVEIKKLTQEWEMAASSLVDCLSEGNQALIDAMQETERCCEECPSSSTVDCKSENTVTVLERRLFHAQKLVKQTENKVRTLSEACLAIADMQGNEKANMQSELETCQLLLAEKTSQMNNLGAKARYWRARAERSETDLLAACVVINRSSETCLMVDSLKNENNRLVEALKKSQQHAARTAAELEGLSSEYSASVYSVMECWLNDKIATVFETELLRYQMMEDCSISEAQLQALESQCHDRLMCFEEKCGAIAQKITETDVIVQELEDKLQASKLQLQVCQVEIIQAKKDKGRLSMDLEGLMVKSTCDKFASALEMDIIHHLLIQGFQEGWLQLTLELMEARKVSTDLMNDKCEKFSRMEVMISEIAMLKAQSMIEQEFSASVTKQLSQSHDLLSLLKAQAEQAQVRSEQLDFHSRDIQENLSLHIFFLVLEEAIVKELLVSQETILESEAMNFKSKFNGLQRDVQEYMDKVDALTSLNANLMQAVESITEAAQCCLVQYQILVAGLKCREKLTSVAEAEQASLGEILVSKSQGTDQDLDFEAYFKDNKNGSSVKQRVQQVQKGLVKMQQGLKDCSNEINILFKERDRLLSHENQEDYLCKVVNTELQTSHSELTRIQLVAEACCIVGQVKEEYRSLLETVLQQQSEFLLLQIELQQTRDYLNHMQSIHCSHQEKLQQLLEQDEKLSDQKISHKEWQLELQHTQLNEVMETVDQIYKDVSKQLHSRNLKIEKSYHQQQILVTSLFSLSLKNELLQEELNIRMNQFCEADASGVASSQCINCIGSSRNSEFDRDRVFIENEKLKVEVERQRGDMDCIQCELTRSCNIVFEVRHTHLKTLETLHETEELLLQQTEAFNAKSASFCELEENYKNFQKQMLELSQENCELMIQYTRLKEELNLFEVVQGEVVKSVDAVEIKEAKFLALLSDLDCLFASNLIERRSSELATAFEDCQQMLNNLETVITLNSGVVGGSATFDASSNQVEFFAESRALQMKAMSERISILERENDHLQGQKSKRLAAMKALQLHCQQEENLHNVLRQTSAGSENLLEVAERNETKLTGLQIKIQEMTEWISQEIGDDFKIAFTEGCEMVLNAVETEVQTCREQAEIAWRKFDSVVAEKKELEEILLKKNEMVKSLQNEVVVLQDQLGVTRQESVEVDRLNALVKQVQGRLDEKEFGVAKLGERISHLQDSSAVASSQVDALEANLFEQKEELFAVKNENMHLRLQLQDLVAVKELNEADLDEKEHAIHVLEMQVQAFKSLLEEEKVFSLDGINEDLNYTLKERDLAVKERDELHADLVVLSEQLEMAQQIAEEHEAVAVEARQIAEASKTRAEQKEEEARLLEQSVEELESTVSALETQVGVVRSETERQRLMREDTEMELQALKHQMSIMQAHQADNDVLQSKWEQMQRCLEEKKNKLLDAEEKIEVLEKKCEEKNNQIKKYKNDIMDIISEADRQATDHHQIVKTLESMAGQKSLNEVVINSKPSDRCAVKPRGSGSPFKCMGSGLAHQMSFEVDEELNCNRQKIDELEALANSRQKEIFMLNVRLAEAESMTHDVIRDLVGVKLDITNYAAFVSHEQGQNNVAKVVLPSHLAGEKEKELTNLKAQLNDFIEERESWLEEINRRQAEMMTARVAAEKLRQRDQLLSTELETLKVENVSQRNRLAELEEEVNKLSGQQNLQQRIHHHAKIKEENNQLRLKNEDLATKLRRSEVLLTRVAEELAQYREADGRTPYIDFEEEQRLRLKLEEVEEEKIQIAQELLTLCTSVLQVAGITSAKVVDQTVAAEALQHLQDRLDAADREISDMKLKNRIDSEKTRLSELRSLHSPVPARLVSVAQQCTSPSL
ncbi:hypothetical protein GOP47_0024380 [Adiantum capillus-veneris]|uniref:Kinesin motor domain-containing protein n=1 Tax=Adiantum capillus-veneris TaxID=13818 RepID=A0A9D4U226_ADICA|nr:hypothetical protein GOP47_0024380 [Adiantum capillus-veneris]